jgi:hypothetical protein
LPVVEDELELELPDREARVAVADHQLARFVHARAVAGVAAVQAIQERFAPRRRLGVGRKREDRVALDLRERERRRDLLDDPVEEARQQRVRAWDERAGGHVRRVSLADGLEERGVPGDVREDERPVLDRLLIRRRHARPS